MAKQKTTQGMAIACLLLNMFVIPGLGSVVAKRKEGVTQLVLAIVSIPLMLVLIGFITLPMVWIWSLVSGIQAIQEAE